MLNNTDMLFQEIIWKNENKRHDPLLGKQEWQKVQPGGALPYVDGYQVPVNRPPFFTPTLHPMTPIFLFSPHPMTPFFPLLYQILHKNCEFFERSSRILRNLTILWQF